MFRDRLEAGAILAEKLSQYKGRNGVVLAVPRGGVPVAYVVAKELNLPLELLLTKKIGHPYNKEYAIGAVSLSDSYIVPHPDISPSYIESEIKAVREKLKMMSVKFKGGIVHNDLKDKIVIVIDDGIATGNTLMASLTIIKKQHPQRIVIAVPVAPSDTIKKFEKLTDEFICVLAPDDFHGVGAFYENFQQVSDEEVIYYLNKHADETPPDNKN